MNNALALKKLRNILKKKSVKNNARVIVVYPDEKVTDNMLSENAGSLVIKLTDKIERNTVVTH